MSRLEKTFYDLDESVQIKLQDLSEVLKEVTTDRNEWVYTYRKKSELAPAMYADFIEHNEDKYIFSDDLPEEGILSLCHAYQSIATMVDGMELKSEDAKIRLNVILHQIIDAVEDGNDSYVFDAKPYRIDSMDMGNMEFLDSMTWVGSALLSALRLHINGKIALSNEELKSICKILKHCLLYIKDGFICDEAVRVKYLSAEGLAEGNTLADIDPRVDLKGESDEDDEKRGAFRFGWNFTNGCSEQPSLYFTYAVCEFFLDMYSTFSDYMAFQDEAYLKRMISRRLDAQFEANKEALENDDIDSEKSKKEQLARTNLEVDKTEKAKNAEKQKEIFLQINGGLDAYHNNSLYFAVERSCKIAANRVWDIVRSFEGGLNENFFSADLSTTVEEKSIESSITSDAIFNLIFIVNIIIDAAIDEDYEDKVSYYTLSGTKAYETALNNYDELRDALRFAYDNAFLAYTRLAKNGKEYKANEYILNFDEKYGKEYAEVVKELRKARIREFSLMPLLVKTKTTMGEFVIRYPQYDMQIYLENILNHRVADPKDKDAYLWIWEKDGFFSSSNYYFISALADFYAYYETYETTAANNMDEYRKALESEDGAIGRLNKRVKELENDLANEKARVEKLEEEKKELQNADPFVTELKRKISETVADFLTDSRNVGDILAKLSGEIVAEAKARVDAKYRAAVARMEEGADVDKKNEATEANKWYNATDDDGNPVVPVEYSELGSGLRDIGKALLAESLYNAAYDGVYRGNDQSTDRVDETFNVMADFAEKDLYQAMGYYTRPMYKEQHSYYVRKQGLATIVNDIEALEEKIKELEKKINKG